MPRAADLSADLAEKRRILQLETLYDLALTLHAERGEVDLVEDLLQQVCAVLDPSAALAVTRDEIGAVRALATVGWAGALSPEDLQADPIWREISAEGRPLQRAEGRIAGRFYRDLLAAPLLYRGRPLGFLALLDKESRRAVSGGPAVGLQEQGFTAEDRRFLDSVAALAGVALASGRRLEELAAQRERLAEENKALKDRLVAELAGHRIVAQAAPMRRVLDLVERVAPRNVNILLRGESGTGKELVARLLHSLSGRKGALIALNCAALPEALLESELFGIEGGVATGVQARRGKFELAHGGTLFLDEIGDMVPALQVKLLRALQEREVLRIGGAKPIAVDVRVIAATHRQLEARIQEGRFREDLYYRLKGVDLELPALRERRQDIPHLVRLFVEQFCQREAIEPPAIEPDALTLLLAYDFPGNVRELQNLVEGAVSLAEGPIGSELVRSLMGGAGEESGEPIELEAVERRHILRVIRLADGNKSTAARLLGIDRRTLQRKGF